MGARIRAALETAWAKAGVDLTLAGHHHSYQRTCPALEGECVPLAADGSAPVPVHVVMGHGGAGKSPIEKTMPKPFVVAVYGGASAGPRQHERYSCLTPLEQSTATCAFR